VLGASPEGDGEELRRLEDVLRQLEAALGTRN